MMNRAELSQLFHNLIACREAVEMHRRKLAEAKNNLAEANRVLSSADYTYSKALIEAELEETTDA